MRRLQLRRDRDTKLKHRTPGHPDRAGLTPTPPSQGSWKPAGRDMELGGPQVKKPMSDPPGEEGKLKDPQSCPKAGEMKLVETLSGTVSGAGRGVLRAVLYLFPVYLVGRFGLSLTWLLLGLFLWIVWNRNKDNKLARMRAAWDLLDNERLGVTRGLNLHQLPAWVNFPDVERVEWINKVVGQMWPYLGMYVEKLFLEKIEPMIRSTSVHLKAFTFTKVHLGEKSPRIHGVKAYTKNVDKREVILDLQLSYTGDCEINVEVKKMCKAGVKGVQLHGTLRVILAPLISDLPFIGAVTMFFIQKPHLDINWTGLTNVLEIPGVSDFSDTMIVDIIASYLVLPNRFTVPLCKNIDVAQLRFPLPHGVLRLHLIEAADLIPKDNYLKGMIKGKSDPYAVMRIGNQSFKSKTIKENLNPCWREMYEFVVHEVPGQDLEVDLYDEDPDKDDFLGSLVIGLEGVMKDRVVNEWFPLSEVASGMVHLKLEWLSLMVEPDKISEPRNGLSTAMLIVYLDGASDLPRNHQEYLTTEHSAKKQSYLSYPKTDKDPSTHVQISVGKKNVKSKTCGSTKDPVWEQAFAFFVQDIHMQHLHLKVKDDERECVLGMLDLPLHRIITSAAMTLEQRFPLTNSGPNSNIKMKIVLRALHIEDPESDGIYTGINSLKHGPVTIKRDNKPQDKSSEVHQIQQNHIAPQANVESNELTGHSMRSTRSMNTDVKPAPNQNLQGTNTSQTLRAMRKFAPSLLSLNSVASSVYDGKGWPAEMSGEILITVRYASLRHCLVVGINSCRNLIQCSANGADPYVRIYLLPDRRWSGRKRTSVKKKTLDPQYDERFEYLVSIEDAKKRTLDIAVKNNRSFGSHERKELGKVLVDLSGEDLNKGFNNWYHLTPTGHPGP